MNQRTFLLGITIVFLMFTVHLCHGADTLKLRLNLEAGKAYNIKMSMEQTVTQLIKGASLDMTQGMSMGYNFKVTGVDEEGAFLVDVAYDSIAMKQTSQMGTVEYDSSNPPEVIPPQARSLAAFVGENFTIQLLNNGSVKEVGGIDEMLARVIGKLSLPEGPTKEFVVQALKEQFGPAAIKKTMENMFSFYPDKPVAVGDTWKKHIVINTGFPMVLDYVWILKERNNFVALLEGNTEISQHPEPKVMSMGAMNIRYDITGTQEGTIEVNEKTGWIVKGNLTQEFKGYVYLEGQEQEGADQEASWPVSGTSVITFEGL